MWLSLLLGLTAPAPAATLCVPASYDPAGPDCDLANERRASLSEALTALSLSPGSHVIRLEPGYVQTASIEFSGLEPWDDIRIQGDGSGASIAPVFFAGPTFRVGATNRVEVENLTFVVETNAQGIVNAGDLTLREVTLERSSTDSTLYPAIEQNGGTLDLIDATFLAWESSTAVGHLDIIGGVTTISGGSFTGGQGLDAGAIRADGVVSIDGTHFDGNIATAVSGGGAIHVASSGDVAIADALFTGNEAQATSGDAGGGAIHALGGAVVTLDRTVFDGNLALGGKGGGAIFIDGASTVLDVRAGVEFLSNGASGRGGGAIYVEEGDLDVDQAYFFDNFADDQRGGGAVYSERGDLSISSSTFEGNRSETGSDGGGAVYIRKPPNNSGGWSFPFAANTFLGNTSDVEGGAIYVHTDNDPFELVVSDNRFEGNESAFSGGAIVMTDQTLTSAGNVYVGNLATGGPSAAGGAIALQNGSLPSTSTNDTFCGQNATGRGGAISLTGVADLTVTGGVFFENVSSEEGGAIRSDGAGLTLDRSTFVANEGNGAALNTANGVSVLSSLFMEHQTEAVVRGATGTFDHNAYWMNVPAPGVSTGLSPNDITTDPRVTAPPSGTCVREDFRPLFGSSLQDAGSAGVDIGALAVPSDPDDQDADGFLSSVDDCDDTNPAINPSAIEISCNGIDENCDPTDDEPDEDADGSSICDAEPDCEDMNPSISPLVDEICNGIDDDCDGDVDDDDADLVATAWFPDADNDGYGDDGVAGLVQCTQPADTVGNGLDCDDTNAGVSPDANEVCNGFDDDCDGDVDDDDASLSNGALVYEDADADGFGGNSDPGQRFCVQPSGAVTVQGDCDDTVASINPDADEICAPGDEDCDGLEGSDDPSLVGGTLYYDDLDMDGYGDDSDPGQASCDPVPGKVANALDCNDNAFGVSPDAVELCNGVDTDCSGVVDDNEAFQTVWYADADGDSYGDPSTSTMTCPAPAAHVSNDDDCNDAFNTDYPGAPELCDGRDNDCNGQIDDQAPMVDWYPDADEDGFGDGTATPVQSCSQPPGLVQSTTDCNDADATINPGQDELCDPVDRDCDGDPIAGAVDAETRWLDGDGDGFGDPDIQLTACTHPASYVDNPGDCNDSQPFAWTNADEVCDQVDNDCNGAIDGDEAIDASEWWPDLDNDLFGAGDPILACVQPTGHRANDDDCDDTTNAISPAEPEQCDGEDNDCNGLVDDGVVEQSWYRDADGDGFGDPLDVAMNCLRPAGYVSAATDCDDTDPLIGPGAVDLCDGIDDNCSGDESDAANAQSLFPDIDGDTWGEIGAVVQACPGTPGLSDRVGDCDDQTAAVNPDATEVCDGLDNDCDGQVDVNATDQIQYFDDEDGDGFGNLDAPVFRCEDLYTDVSLVSTDCDDTDELVNPIAPEICGDEIDNDCDTLVNLDDDDVSAALYWPDLDGDGYGDVTAEPVESCDGAPSGTVDNDQDCDDGESLAWTGAVERCDGVDNDCDGDVDADDASIDPDEVGEWYPDVDGDGFGDASAQPEVVCEQPPGTVANADDCLDDAAAVAPGAEEVCGDGLDNNCDGVVDEECARTRRSSGCSCDTPASPALWRGVFAGLLVWVRRRSRRAA
jgi:hypothetical protein